MKRIRKITDIEELKEMGSIPLDYVTVIESEFITWFEAEGVGDSLDEFEMPQYACMYHLDDKHDTTFLSIQKVNIEFVEKEELKGCAYFRIGIMNDHQMNLVYVLEGILDHDFEEWLEQ